MKPICKQPGHLVHLLDASRRDAPLEWQLLQHLDTCESCRTSVERTRRLARTWRALAPTTAETAAAWAKFSPGRRSWTMLRPAQAAALMLVVAATSAGAATGVARSTQLWRSIASISLPRRATASAHASKAQRPQAPPDSAPALSQAESARAQTESARATPVDRVDNVSPSPTTKEHRTLPLGHRPPASRAGEPGHLSVPPVIPEPVASSRRWIDAATAMREGNYAEAEIAFTQLAHSTDPPTRDAARLARAQIWIAEGRVLKAQPELEELSTTGATAFVRGRANEALLKIR